MTVNMVTSGQDEGVRLMESAKANGFHAYRARNVVAIEFPGATKEQAQDKAEAIAEGTSAFVAYVYE